ncbi:MAG: HlyD family efflux transporter periplasmic adaptor subunit [Telmatospirillum sp.]|nr:HlyD family efflux transporter periplasmic adaptor subunit [Telmatospirillum sp.]
MPSPWTGGAGPFDRRALDPDAPFGRAHYRHRAVSLEARLLRRDRHVSEAMVDGRRIPVTARTSAGLWRGEVAGMRFAALWHRDHLEMIVAGTRIQLSPVVDGVQDMSGPGDGAVLAPMPGSVVALAVEVGSRVERNAVIAIVEAMKMENRIHAPIDGTVTEISCRIGDIVAAGQSLATIAAAAAPS